MNISALTGRLVRDPELRATSSGKSVVSFTIAVIDPDNKDNTDYVDCVAWDSKAEFLSKYFSKGKKVEITGKIKTRTYEKDGQNRKVTEVVVKTIGFAESKKDSSGDETENNSSSYNAEETGSLDGFSLMDAGDDDLPF